jgi:hypothetical protein
MADSIFRYEDRDGDELDVYRGNAGALTFHATKAEDSALTSVHLNPEAVLQLRDALTAWVGFSTPEPGFTTPSDVRAIVTKMLADVLPLHQAPQAAVPAPLCTLPGCDKFPASSEHFEHDPEPRDVGHPEPYAGDEWVPLTGTSWHNMSAADNLLWAENAAPLCDGVRPLGVDADDECPACAHLWAVHAAPAPSAPRQLVGCECGHGWGVHEAISGGCTARVQGWGEPSVCECVLTPPSAS